MDKQVKKYGYDEKMNLLKVLLQEREVLKATKNNTSELDKKLEDEIFTDVFFSPKKALVISDLSQENKIKTTEEKELLIKLIEEEQAKKEQSPILNIRKDIIELIGENKTLKRRKVFKYNSTMKKYNEYAYVPVTLKSLCDNPLDMVNVSQIPSSVFRAMVEVGESSVTKKDVLSLTIVSLVYDEFSDEFVRHQWKCMYEIIPEVVELSVNPENIDDDGEL